MTHPTPLRRVTDHWYKHYRGPVQPAPNGGMFARRATFLLTIPTSAPDLPSHGEAPQVDPPPRVYTDPTHCNDPLKYNDPF